MGRRTYNVGFMPSKLREWRKHKGLTLDELVQALTERGVDTTQGSLSRIERGLQGWNQPILQACAEVLDVEIPQLIMEEPGSRRAALSDLCRQLDETELAQVESVVRALFPK